MLQFTYPGVYTQELPSGVRSLTGSPTSVALFVGPTLTGIDARPIRCLSFADFERGFGGLTQTSNLSYSVLHFFANGGGVAWVIRVPPADATAPSSTVIKDVAGSNPSLKITALSSGTAANDIFVEFDAFNIDAHPFSTVAPLHDKKRFTLTVTDTVTGRAERFGNLTTAASSARFAPNVVNDIATGSKLIKIAMLAPDTEGPKATGTHHRITTFPGTGTFASGIKLRMSVDRVAPDGTADVSNSIVDLPVTVFASGSPQPTSKLQLSVALAKALNETLRASPLELAKLNDASIEAAVFEGDLLRLRLSQPSGPVTAARIHDATVTIKAPSSGTSFLTTFGLGSSAIVANPSRYRLGSPYTGSQISANAPGTASAAHGQPDSTAFKDAVTALSTPDPFFNTLCLPDAVRPSTSDPTALHHTNSAVIYTEAAQVCEGKFAFLVVDPPPNAVDTGSAEAWKQSGFLFQSSHAGAWFPNIRVDDPLEPGAIRSHPPSGAIAGVIARTDAEVGVWQAPAGTEAIIAGAYGPSSELSDSEQGILNPIGLNVIRRFPVYGTVAFGSRTVDGANAMASEWKYIPVRRTANYILRSLSEGLKWAVHKPNGEDLWGQLRVSCKGFMHGLFRQGAFKGISAREAYFVICDASSTTSEDIDAGIVNIIIGFAPLKPAEFVVISLRQIVQARN